MQIGGKKLILAVIQLALSAGCIYLVYSHTNADVPSSITPYLIYAALLGLIGSIIYSVVSSGSKSESYQNISRVLVEGSENPEDLKKTIILIKTHSDDESASLVMALSGLLEQLERKLSSSDSDQSNLKAQFLDLEQELAKLQQTHQELQQQPHQRSEFLSLMGDEITSPMQSLNSMLKLLSQTELDQETSHLLKIAIHSAYSLTENITNILEFNKLDAGLLTLETDTFVVKECIKQVLETQESIALSKSLLLEKHISGDVPKTINAPEKAMKKVLNNLISNAIRFTDEGSISLSVDRTMKDEQTYIRFKIQDTGIGVPAQAIDTLFDSLDKTTHLKNSSFTGRLRLIVCKGLCELMGGEIGVQSTEGQGSLFWFTVRL